MSIIWLKVSSDEASIVTKASMGGRGGGCTIIIFYDVYLSLNHFSFIFVSTSNEYTQSKYLQLVKIKLP